MGIAKLPHSEDDLLEIKKHRRISENEETMGDFTKGGNLGKSISGNQQLAGGLDSYIKRLKANWKRAI